MLNRPFKIIDVACQNRELSVNDVDCLISSFSNRLSELYSGNGCVVVCLERSAELVCCVSSLISLGIPYSLKLPDWTPSEDGYFSLYVKDGKSNDGQFNINIINKSEGMDSAAVSSVKAEDKQRKSPFCYSITTSGSTGVPKIVEVPIECIWSNIEDFTFRFEITAKDVILFSTSVLFDPSVIEIFLCLSTEATMVITSDFDRSNPNILIEVIRQKQCTVVQLSPAVLFLMNEASLKWLLGDNSTVRILLVGGEMFPINLIRKHRSKKNKTRIFDVYGITEMSCWATVFEVGHECRDVFLGDPIKDTELVVKEDGALFLDGSRRCLIDHTWPSGPVPTGDIVEKVNGKWKVVGRCDDQIKFNGIRCSLSQLSAKISKSEGVKWARIILYRNSFLVLFVQKSHEDDQVAAKDQLLKLFPDLLKPAWVFEIDEVPINSNGKVSVPALLSIATTSINDPRESFWRILASIGISEHTADFSRSLVQYGIKSLTAAELAFLFDRPDAIHVFLDPEISLGNVVEQFLGQNAAFTAKNNVGKNARDYGARKYNTNADSDFDLITIECGTNIDPELLWRYDTGKCIDGNPLILWSFGIPRVVIASHSGRVASLNLTNGTVYWEKTVSARFEASPVLYKSWIVVGSCQGSLHYFDASSGDFVEVSFGDQIKAAAVVSGCSLFVITYEPMLYRIDSQDIVWGAELIAGSPATPLLLNDGKTIICTTIKGSVEAFETDTGKECWKLSIGAPIFSSPVALDSRIFITSVDGRLRSIDVTAGVMVSSTDLLSGPIFSPVSTLIDGFLIILSQTGIATFVDSTSLEVYRKLVFPNAKFVRPPFLVNDVGKIGFMDTCGLMFEVNMERLKKTKPNGPVEAMTYQLSSGEVFSTPRLVEFQNQMFLIVGSRDNFVKCFKRKL